MEKRHNRKNLSCENEYERVCVRMEHGFETRGGEGMCVDLFLFILWEENNPPSHQIGEPFFGIHTSLPPPPLKAHTPPKRNVPSGLVCAYRVGTNNPCVCVPQNVGDPYKTQPLQNQNGQHPPPS
mmetsp:Transcript_16692/g.20404  ORF Transcript_16692/g.20404 Transcript_16692/m.20404 type:complete len:125 (+) Transcript_16692:115-489(+)